LLHEMLLVAVRVKKVPFAPYRTLVVPLNEQVPFSEAQRIQVVAPNLDARLGIVGSVDTG
jgi:hypothetical protein